MERKYQNELYEKMKAEQEAYEAKLLTMPPEEILKYAREYIAGEDILEAVYCGVLSEKSEKAMLRSASPLGDVVKEYRDMDRQNEDILTALYDTADKAVEPPVYRHTAQYAMEHGERDAYFASRKAYEDCKRAIENAIDSNFDGAYLGKSCVAEVMEGFGPERITDVLACTIQRKEWDERFSRSNRDWAKKVDISHMGKEPYSFVCESHPAVLDGFISMFRREVLEQSKTEKAATPAQHKPKERSDDFEL